MARSVVGLDIGSSCIKAVQMRKKGREIELEKFGVAQVNPGGPPPTGPSAREARIRAIQTALANGKITTKNVVSSVSGESIIVRYIQLPEMPENELKEALKWEAEEYIPFSLDEVNIDSTILGKSEDGTSVNVLLVAAKNELLRDHIDLIRAAKLQPEVIDVDSFAFMNSFEMNYSPDASQAVALVNIGAHVTNINIYHSNVSHFSRDIGLGGDSITQALQNKVGGEWADAEQLKIAAGAPDVDALGGDIGMGAGMSEDGDDASSLLDTIRGTVDRLTGENEVDESPEDVATKLVRATLDNLMSEIRRSVQFFENQSNGRSVQTIMLGGGTSRMKNIAEYFRAEMNIDVQIMDPTNGVTPSMKTVDPAALDSEKNLLGVGIGLALRKLL